MGETELDEALSRLEAATCLAEIQEIVRGTARHIVAAHGATFVLRDGEQCFYADEDAMSPLWKGQRFPITACISGWTMLNGTVAVVADISEDDRIPLEVYRPTFVRSLVMVPVGADGPLGAFAAIGAYWSHPYEASAEDVSKLESLAVGTAAAIDRVGLDDAPFTPTLLARSARQPTLHVG
ncbi:MAG: GAF domain-containing protein [Acidimicrobiales bacterium]